MKTCTKKQLIIYMRFKISKEIQENFEHWLGKVILKSNIHKIIISELEEYSLKKEMI